MNRVMALPPTLLAVALVAGGTCVPAQAANADSFVPVNLSGFAFEDVNGNGVYDFGEWPLDSWLINLHHSAISTSNVQPAEVGVSGERSST